MLDIDEQERGGDRREQTDTPEASGNNGADEKSDKLWATFLSDVGTRPKDGSPAAQSQTPPTVTVTLFGFPTLQTNKGFNHDSIILDLKCMFFTAV